MDRHGLPRLFRLSMNVNESTTRLAQWFFMQKRFKDPERLNSKELVCEDGSFGSVAKSRESVHRHVVIQDRNCILVLANAQDQRLMRYE